MVVTNVSDVSWLKRLLSGGLRRSVEAGREKAAQQMGGRGGGQEVCDELRRERRLVWARGHVGKGHRNRGLCG